MCRRCRMRAGSIRGDVCAVMLSLCHSDAVIPSNAMLDAGMQAIFNGILALEAENSKLAEVGIDVTPFTGEPIRRTCRSPCSLLGAIVRSNTSTLGSK